jgi:hypothetical protein
MSAPLYTSKELHAEAEAIVVGRFGIDATYYSLKRIRDAYEARISELEAAAIPALAWMDSVPQASDEIYPPGIFDGSSGDEGPVRIAAIRENLRQALQELPNMLPPATTS